MSLTKTIDLSGREYLESGESRVTPLVFSKEYNAFEADSRHSKTAACNEALEYASKIRPVEGKRFLLVSALGDFESWGDNKKADAFPYNAIMGKHPDDVSPEHFAQYAAKIPKTWGLVCFPTKFDSQGNQIGGGNTFNEHNNRFPSSFLGQKNHYTSTASRGDTRCGDVLAAFWNERMRRVELIQEVWESRLRHIVRAIDEGYKPGISMACDIPCDRCSVCGHLSTSESNYCVHLQRSNGLRGVIKSDGVPVVMLNDYPYFFDSSIVKSKAAGEAGTLMKIASYSFNVTPERRYEPAGSRNSKSDLMHLSKVQAGRLQEEGFSEKVANVFRTVPLVKLASYLGTMGIYPTCTDIAQLMFGKSASSNKAGRDAESLLLGVLANEVDLTNNISSSDILVPLDDGTSYDEAEFQKVASASSSIAAAKSFLSPFVDTRPDPMRVSLDTPFSELDDKSKAVLLAKIFTDKGLHDKVQELLVKPAVRWELEKLGLDGIYSSSRKNLPVYDKLADSYLSGLAAHRMDKLYK